MQFAGFTDNDNARSRMNGVKEAIGDEVRRNATGCPTAWISTRPATMCATRSTNHKDLVALIGIWAYNAPAIADVVKERELRDKYVVVDVRRRRPSRSRRWQRATSTRWCVQNPFDMGVQTVRAAEGDDLKTTRRRSRKCFRITGNPTATSTRPACELVVPDDESRRSSRSVRSESRRVHDAADSRPGSRSTACTAHEARSRRIPLGRGGRCLLRTSSRWCWRSLVVVVLTAC